MPGTGKPTPEEMKKMFEEMQRKENEGLTPEEIEKKNKEKEVKKRKNVARIQETLEICREGEYVKDGVTVSLGLSAAQMTEARVLLPDEVRSLPEPDADTACAFSCENEDALTLAREKYDDPSYGGGGDAGGGGSKGDGGGGDAGGGGSKGDGADGSDADADAGGGDDISGNRILLLNLASAVKPGGGVRDGMGGQEEGLCRKSSLLLSLESDAAKPYYEYNTKLDTLLGSDAVIVSPEVAVFRDAENELLDAPFTISVITCSAPNVRFGCEGKTEEEYEALLYDRIEGLLRCAGSLGYKNIVLGAFGCGAFKNDAALVSDLFYKALTGSAGRGLEHADFAVLCTPGKEYNYDEFARNFSAEKSRR